MRLVYPEIVKDLCGSKKISPLLEAPEREWNLVNFGLPKDQRLFLGSEWKGEETTKTWLKLRKSFPDCLNETESVSGLLA